MYSARSEFELEPEVHLLRLDRHGLNWSSPFQNFPVFHLHLHQLQLREALQRVDSQYCIRDGAPDHSHSRLASPWRANQSVHGAVDRNSVQLCADDHFWRARRGEGEHASEHFGPDSPLLHAFSARRRPSGREKHEEEPPVDDYRLHKSGHVLGVRHRNHVLH